jgi:predicted transposase YbfD/YdcC
MDCLHDTTGRDTLVEYLAMIPDPRNERGRRYEWLYLLTVIAAAMMSGESNPTGISAWVSEHKEALACWLGPVYRYVPSVSTLRRVFYAVSIEALEGAVGAYLQALRGEMGESGQIVTQRGERLQGLAVDGKTVRCATAHGAVTHLVSVVGHEDGIVLSQANARAKLDETTVARKLLAALPLEKTVITFDALHTSIEQAKQIRQADGHYLFVVKRNQKCLYRDIDDGFSVLPPQGSCEEEFWQYECCELTDRSHGRTSRIFLESTTALNHFLSFPDVAQVIRRTRWVRNHRTQIESQHVEYLVTSLDRKQVTLEQLGLVRRRHWTIENVTHYPRDVSFGEDRCHTHTRSAAQALAAMRNAVIGTLRAEGWPYLPNGFRYCRSHLQQSLQWIGITAT